MIEVTTPVQRALERLVKTGLYGRNVEDAAERLLCRALEDQRRETMQPLEDACPKSDDGQHFPGCGCD